MQHKPLLDLGDFPWVSSREFCWCGSTQCSRPHRLPGERAGVHHRVEAKAAYVVLIFRPAIKGCAHFGNTGSAGDGIQPHWNLLTRLFLTVNTTADGNPNTSRHSTQHPGTAAAA